jgi:hypothetical protein
MQASEYTRYSASPTLHKGIYTCIFGLSKEKAVWFFLRKSYFYAGFTKAVKDLEIKTGDFIVNILVGWPWGSIYLPTSSQILIGPSDHKDRTDPASMPTLPKHGLTTTHSHAKDRKRWLISYAQP